MKIILIRHGEPTSANNPQLYAHEYANWIRRYNTSDVSPNSRPETINSEYASFYIVSSDLKRAVHSTNIYTHKAPNKVSKLYREMEIPRYKLPFKLKAWTWVYLSRLLWMLGCKGSFESFKQAKRRACLATDELIEIANEKGEIVLFSHGFLNRYIRKELMKQGWQLQSKSNQYWGVTCLEKF